MLMASTVYCCPGVVAGFGCILIAERKGRERDSLLVAAEKPGLDKNKVNDSFKFWAWYANTK